MQYDWDVFKGPRAGEPAIDFPLTDLDGNEVCISDFRGRWLVIETGSSTCSMYTKNMPGMKSLREQHPDVTFVVVYVREAHPGERLHQHQTFDEKMSAARTLTPKYNEDRTILALWDFAVALPKLAKRHKLVDDYYAKHGRFKRKPG
jgi:glutathione peroxidase-family protein